MSTQRNLFLISNRVGAFDIIEIDMYFSKLKGLAKSPQITKPKKIERNKHFTSLHFKQTLIVIQSMERDTKTRSYINMC